MTIDIEQNMDASGLAAALRYNSNDALFRLIVAIDRVVNDYEFTARIAEYCEEQKPKPVRPKVGTWFESTYLRGDPWIWFACDKFMATVNADGMMISETWSLFDSDVEKGNRTWRPLKQPEEV